MSDQLRSHRTSMDRARAEALLFPIAAFLCAGGWSKKEAERSFSRAFDNSLDNQGARQLKHIGNPTLYADIIALWTRDRRFIDRSGRPRALTLRGRISFTALAREATSKVDAPEALSVLVHFRNVRRTSSGTYKLVSPFFLTSSAKSMAFEPMAYFLSDASHTLGRILKRKEQSRDADIFWRKAENSDLSEAEARKFLAYSKERSLAFANEIDDWLEAHRRQRIPTRGNHKRRRVGLGVFSIFSRPELLHPNKPRVRHGKNPST
jgi:hypothetical protein